MYKQGTLTQDRIELLESLPEWVWDTFGGGWQIKFKELKNYVSEHGHACVPFENPNLGRWVSRQRLKFKQDKLSQNKVDLLEGLPGWVWVNK